MGQQSNLLVLVATTSVPAVIPAGFLWASINPSEGASYTITNSSTAGGIIVTPAILVPFSFPSPPSLEGFGAHTITASVGDVTIVYTNGN